MARINAQQIVRDVELEIAQGILSKEELGPAIQSIQQFQNKLRAETFAHSGMDDRQRETFSRLFQFNDMLLTLLHEIALRISKFQLFSQNANALPREIVTPAEDLPEQNQAAPLQSEEPKTAPPEVKGNAPTGQAIAWRSKDEIQNVMQQNAIHIEMQTRPFHFPLVGWFLTRLRIFYQRPAYFYSQLIENRQAPVNRVLGDRLLYLEDIIEMQQKQINALQSEIANLTRQRDDPTTIPGSQDLVS